MFVSGLLKRFPRFYILTFFTLWCAYTMLNKKMRRLFCVSLLLVFLFIVDDGESVLQWTFWLAMVALSLTIYGCGAVAAFFLCVFVFVVVSFHPKIRIAKKLFLDTYKVRVDEVARRREELEARAEHVSRQLSLLE
eukprot:PhM_4_TR18925/c0_g1_i1/m.63262